MDDVIGTLPYFLATLQTARARAALLAAGAFDATPTELVCVGARTAAIFLDYERGAVGGAVTLHIETSPHAVDSTVVGDISWYHVSERNYAITYTSASANQEAVAYLVPLPHGTERIRIAAAESGVIGTPGTAAIKLMLDPLAVSDPLTDVQLRAEGVPVTGPLTDTELRAAAVEVQDTWAPVQLSDVTDDDSDKSFTVPASTEYQILGVFIAMATTATVGDRQMVVEVQDDAANVVAQWRAGVVQPESLTRYYQFAVSVADLLAFRDTDYLSTPVAPLVLSAGYVLRVYDSAAVDAAADDMHVRAMVMSRSV